MRKIGYIFLLVLFSCELKKSPEKIEEIGKSNEIVIIGIRYKDNTTDTIRTKRHYLETINLYPEALTIDGKIVAIDVKRYYIIE